MKVFVTGATGLVGSHIVKQLLRADHEVVALRRNQSKLKLAEEFAYQVAWIDGGLDDVAALAEGMQGCDAVVHSAALISFHDADAEKLIKVNLGGTVNMLNAALGQARLPIFCFISSVAALAAKPGKKVVDESAWGDSETRYAPYGKSKFLAELELFRAEAEGLPVFTVNPSMVLGPGYADQGSTALLSYATKRKFFHPTGIINYVDVRDVADAVVGLLNASEALGRRHVLSAGHMHYGEFFAEVAKRAGVAPPTIPVSPFLASLGWRLSAVAAFFTGKKAMLTRQSARSAMREVVYQGANLHASLPHFQYRPFAETLDWALSHMKKD